MSTISKDLGHSNCERCLEARQGYGDHPPSGNYSVLCNDHFEIIVKGKEDDQ